VYENNSHNALGLDLARGTVCYVGVTILQGEGAIFGKNMCLTSLTG